jgi:RNA 2',3'-cyclic 3'-phosphodiesterase
VPADRVPLLMAAAAPAVVGAPAMALRLARGGRFGPPRRPQVMWVGLDGDVRPLTELAGGLADAARALDLPVEDRPFRAHLTVGRWRPREPADGTLPSLLADYRGPAWPVIEVRLLESHLGPSPTYDTLAAWPITR